MHGGEREGAGAHLLAVAQVLGAGEAEREQRRADPRRERRGARRVIGMVVRDEHGRHVRARGSRDLVEVAGVVGAGVDHDHGTAALAEHPRVRALERVGARVRGEHAHDRQHQSSQNTDRGSRTTSSSSGSRVSNVSPAIASALSHAASSSIVAYVGQ